MFCPNCGSEYVEGIRECAECKVRLVEKLPPKDSPQYVHANPVTVLETGNPYVIAVAESLLKKAEISYFLKNQYLQDLWGRFATGFSPAVGPVEIQVRQDDEEAAREVLEDLREKDLVREKVTVQTGRDDQEESTASPKAMRKGHTDTEREEEQEYEYECCECGAIVNAADDKCPVCGAVFDGVVEEDDDRLNRA